MVPDTPERVRDAGYTALPIIHTYAGVSESADETDSKSVAKACGFKSHRQHHKFFLQCIVLFSDALCYKPK